ncbi:iron-containing alcohol dehydrogenase [Novipirellula rosea]|uniref:iron-containing alcohol dehydrogenase n=1 Tax=Novipirellula rosea TaxID=1031540 RepID=UPI0031E9BC9C
MIAMNEGTAIDLGKMIGTLAVQPDDARAIVQGHRWIVGDASPLIAACTTAGTGSEATHFAVVSSTVKNIHSRPPHCCLITPSKIVLRTPKQDWPQGAGVTKHPQCFHH